MREGRSAARALLPLEERAPEAPGFGTELEGRHRFRLMKRLGNGRFGSVFLARRLDPAAGASADAPPERVAVKVFPCRRREADALRRELAALLAIRHPRVPRLHDWSTAGEHAFVAMDHFERGSLAARFGAGPQPDEDEVWQLMEDLLEALAVAHRASILHLDVKPSNVLLGDGGRFALADFGICEAARGGALAPRAKGSAGYRAPEQQERRYAAVDARSDLFGVGATVWAFAAGVDLKRPLRPARAAPRPAGAALPELAGVRGDLSPSLHWMVSELVRLDPDERPGSASEALARLRGITGPAEPPHADLAALGERVVGDDVGALLGQLVDPVTIHLCRDPELRCRIVRLAPGELLCSEGDASDSAFLLLRGAVLDERGGRPPLRVCREGELLAAEAALSGRPRSSLYADGPAWVCVLNAARFERLVADHPALALRLLRSMAERDA
jgi:serine/threonine-protein kinase